MRGENYPDDWTTDSISTLVEVNMGNSPESKYYNKQGKGKPFIQGNSEFSRKYPETERFSENTTKLATENDVLLAVRGATLGEVNIAKEDTVLGRGVAGLSSENVNYEYLYHLLRQLKPYFRSIGVGSTFGSISSRDFNYVEVPNPPLTEQRRIASVLYSVDEQLQVLHDRHDDLSRLKHGLMQDLLTGETRVTPEIGVRSEVEDNPSEIRESKDWKMKRFNDLFKIYSESYRPSEHDEKVIHYSMPAFDEDNPIKEYTSEINSTKRIVPQKTILFPKLNIRKKRFWLVERQSNLPMICSTEYWPLLPRDDKKVFLPFYHQYFQTDEFVDSPLLSTSSSTNSHQRIKRNLVKLEELPVPPLWEQERIASILYTVDEMIARTSDLIDEYERLKRGLMQDLLSGNMRTPEDLSVLDAIELDGDSTGADGSSVTQSTLDV